MATVTETTTTTTTAPPKANAPDPDGPKIVLNGVSWQTYLDLLETEESRHNSVRMMYDRGRLVLMTVSRKHEQIAERLGLLIRLAAAGMGLNCTGVGRWTLKRESVQRGKEPDTAFYLANEPGVRGRELDLEVDPPPDLAVEVEISHHDKGMFEIYAGLGVPEIWVYENEALRVLQFQADGRYADVSVSPGLPFLPLNEINSWLELAAAEGDTAMVLAVLDWARNELAPRARQEGGA